MGQDAKERAAKAYENHPYSEWTAEEKSHANELNRKWARENPERRMVIHARKRAKDGGFPSTITHEDIEIASSCPCCGVEMSKKDGHKGPKDSGPSLDKIKPELGYVPGNIVVVCYRCNRIKNDATIDELERLVKFYRSL